MCRYNKSNMTDLIQSLLPWFEFWRNRKWFVETLSAHQPVGLLCLTLQADRQTERQTDSPQQKATGGQQTELNNSTAAMTAVRLKFFPFWRKGRGFLP